MTIHSQHHFTIVQSQNNSEWWDVSEWDEKKKSLGLSPKEGNWFQNICRLNIALNVNDRNCWQSLFWFVSELYLLLVHFPSLLQSIHQQGCTHSLTSALYVIHYELQHTSLFASEWGDCTLVLPFLHQQSYSHPSHSHVAAVYFGFRTLSIKPLAGGACCLITKQLSVKSSFLEEGTTCKYESGPKFAYGWQARRWPAKDGVAGVWRWWKTSVFRWQFFYSASVIVSTLPVELHMPFSLPCSTTFLAVVSVAASQIRFSVTVKDCCVFLCFVPCPQCDPFF